ncbi:MAG: alpha/beta hydrolase, partial [Afipia sp.]|nr:alpha/beta hydrolase [Afipia sp.]
DIPALIAWGGVSHRSVQRANALLGKALPRATAASIAGAAHFMIATHAEQVAQLIARHVLDADAAQQRSGCL